MHQLPRGALRAISVVGKQQRFIITRTMQDMDDRHPFIPDAIEYQIIAVHPPPQSEVRVTRNHRKGIRHIGKSTGLADQFSDEATCPGRVVLRDIVADLLQIAQRLGAQNDLHRRSVIPAYRASSVAAAASRSTTRPLSTSAMPRAIDASSAASRISRSWIRRTPSRNISLREL